MNKITNQIFPHIEMMAEYSDCVEKPLKDVNAEIKQKKFIEWKSKHKYNKKKK